MLLSSELIPSSPKSYDKWMARSCVAIAAGAAPMSVDGRTVQITLHDHTLSSSSGPLNADVTGDGRSDLPGLSTIASSGYVANGGATNTYGSIAAAAFDGGYIGLARFSYRSRSDISIGRTYFITIGGYFAIDDVPVFSQAFVPITFKDARIHNGAVTGAWLEVRAASLAPSNNSITLIRTVFDDNSTNASVGGFSPGVPNIEWLSPLERAAILKQISKLKRKAKFFLIRARKANRAGNPREARKLRRKFKRVRAQQKALSAQL